MCVCLWRVPLCLTKLTVCNDAEANQSNPNLQVAWQRLQPRRSPADNNSNQAACLDPQCAWHETRLGSPGVTILLGKLLRGFRETDWKATYLNQDASHLLSASVSSEADRFILTTEDDSRAFLHKLEVYLIPGCWHVALWVTQNPRLQMETVAAFSGGVTRWLQRGTKVKNHDSFYFPFFLLPQPLLVPLSFLEPDPWQEDLFV